MVETVAPLAWDLFILHKTSPQRDMYKEYISFWFCSLPQSCEANPGETLLSAFIGYFGKFRKPEWNPEKEHPCSIKWPPPPTPSRGIRLKEKSLGIVRSCTTNPSLDLRIYFSHLMPPHFKIFFFRTLVFFVTTCLLAFNINIRFNSKSGWTPSYYIH